ncbi:MAG: hypothetical protein ABL994_01100 [Verrucomicrobiales bacterium]
MILALPKSFSPEDLAHAGENLRQFDRAIQYPFTHDMELIAAAASDARGEILVFTESHCIPFADFLSASENVLSDHLDWCAFSGHSIPITHNLLSEVEAEMYAADINRHLVDHPWLKVLDQCFIIHRSAYLETGGIEPEYGHYAEWVIAARLKAAGLMVGFSEKVRIRHYYSGDLPELVEFAEDFGAGQIRYYRAHGLLGDGEGTDSPSLWENRAAWDRRNARRILAMLRCTEGSLSGRPKKDRKRRLLLWLARATFGVFADSLALHHTLRKRRRATVRALSAGDRKLAAASYLKLNDTACRIGQLNELRGYEGKSQDFAIPRDEIGVWQPSGEGSATLVGFEASSDIDGTRLIWSAPEAMIRLPIPEGRFLVQLLSPSLCRMEAGTVQFFFQGKPLSPTRVDIRTGLADFTVEVSGSEGAWLGWVAPEQRFQNDHRALGILVKSIRWELDTCGPSGTRPVDLREPVYFLHIMKTMGTTARCAIDNAFTRNETFSPEGEFYYQSEISRAKEAHTHRKSLYRGHFGWGLIDALELHPCSVITTLRDPEERLLSLFDYLKMLERLPEGMDLESFLLNRLQSSDSMLHYFLPNPIEPDEFGVEELGAAMAPCLPTALENLRKCHLVTLMEFPEDSLLMLCHTVGAWPPDPGRKINASRRLSIKDTLPDRTLELLKRLTMSDAGLYDEGRRIFAEHRIRTLKELDVDPSSDAAIEEARKELRRRIRTKAEPEILLNQQWRASGPFFGSNLQSRECHRGTPLRWTGPDPETCFTWALPSKGEWGFHLHLVSATPPAHAEAATLTVNGHLIPLEVYSGDSGQLLDLRCQIPRSALLESRDNWHNFVLSSPVAALPGETVRVVGLCLKRWEFFPC